MTEQSKLSEFLDAPSTLYYCGFKASNIGADNEDEIEAILSKREGHSLHKIIDGNEPLRPVIDFDLP
uniref:Uncharacterized protein n=1 Tax=Rhizophagus irregularis (strain DAOM 181602 / DAOM 197198 / MUCL 43194) TaxID=747089 RepID=U9UUP6_RHIID